MLRVDVIDDIAATEEMRSGWDDLAVALGKPYCCPAWMTSWWRHAAPPGARLRIIVAHEGDELLGVAPLYAQSRAEGYDRYRLLAAPVSARVEPLARPGFEEWVGNAVVSTLQRLNPRPSAIALDGITVDSLWPKLLTQGWPGNGRGWMRRDSPMAAPTLTLSGNSFDQWLKERSGNLRGQLRRRNRRLEEAGASCRLATTTADLDAGLRSFAAMHYERWQWRGGSGVLTPAIEAMLTDVARELAGALRFRLWMITVGDRCISAQIFINAGGEVAYWLGGFDEAWAAHSPAIQTIFEAIKHAWRVGDRRVDLGAGGQPYKYGFATGQDDLEWVTIVPPGPRQLLTRLQLLPVQLRRSVRTSLSAHVPQSTKDKVKRLLRRFRTT
jgi:CelD/BcsL family acetyltransferase involved in cellulose biosynthesis